MKPVGSARSIPAMVAVLLTFAILNGCGGSGSSVVVPGVPRAIVIQHDNDLDTHFQGKNPKILELAHYPVVWVRHNVPLPLPRGRAAHEVGHCEDQYAYGVDAWIKRYDSDQVFREEQEEKRYGTELDVDHPPITDPNAFVAKYGTDTYNAAESPRDAEAFVLAREIATEYNLTGFNELEIALRLIGPEWNGQ
jgi:hypothetical protein